MRIPVLQEPFEIRPVEFHPLEESDDDVTRFGLDGLNARPGARIRSLTAKSRFLTLAGSGPKRSLSSTAKSSALRHLRHIGQALVEVEPHLQLVDVVIRQKRL